MLKVLLIPALFLLSSCSPKLSLPSFSDKEFKPERPLPSPRLVLYSPSEDIEVKKPRIKSNEEYLESFIKGHRR